MPNRGSVEVSESEPKTAWGPVQNRYVDGVGKSAEKTEEQAVVWAKNVGGEVLWRAGGLGGWNMGRFVVGDHVGKGAVNGKGWIVVFVSMLAFP